MSATPIQPVLRLVTGTEAPTPRPSPARHARIGPDASPPGDAIAAENRAASTIAALDPRWIFAVQVKRALLGGRAAVIRPEDRRRLMLAAQRLSLRPFDASLVIAIVQDGARQGEDPLGRDVVSRLKLVSPDLDPELADARRGPTWSMLACAVAVALLTGATATAVLLLV